jgi:hypothetical protein
LADGLAAAPPRITVATAMLTKKTDHVDWLLNKIG